MTSDELSKIASVFQELAERKANDDNPVFRFETPTGATFTYNGFVIQSKRFSQRDVRAIEMIATGSKSQARLYLDLEEGPSLGGARVTGDASIGPAAVRSILEVEGEEGESFALWDEVTAIVAQRKSITASAVNGGGGILVVLAAIVVPLALTVGTLNRMHLRVGSVAEQLGVGLGVAGTLLVAVLSLVALPILFPRITVDGWGRFERTRRTAATWAAAIVAGLVVWAIGLGVDWFLHH